MTIHVIGIYYLNKTRNMTMMIDGDDDVDDDDDDDDDVRW